MLTARRGHGFWLSVESQCQIRLNDVSTQMQLQFSFKIQNIPYSSGICALWRDDDVAADLRDASGPNRDCGFGNEVTGMQLSTLDIWTTPSLYS